jgi:hypothetical protein
VQKECRVVTGVTIRRYRDYVPASRFTKSVLTSYVPHRKVDYPGKIKSLKRSR